MAAARETIQLGGLAAHASSGQFTKQINYPAKIVRVSLRFYPGPELALQVTPYVNWRETLQPIIRTADGQPQYLAGEDDLMAFPCDFPMELGATLVAAWTNTDGVNDYNFALLVEVSARQGGK